MVCSTQEEKEKKEENLRTIVLSKARFINGMDSIVDQIYRGTSWTINQQKDEYPILNIYNEDKLIATHRTWDNITFSDELIKETIT